MNYVARRESENWNNYFPNLDRLLHLLSFVLKEPLPVLSLIHFDTTSKDFDAFQLQLWDCFCREEEWDM